MASSEQALITAAIQETRDLHVFFEGWLAGTLADDSFARVEQALGEEFSVVAPTGVRSDRAATLSSVHAAHGLRRHPDHPFRIWIEAEVPLFVSAGLIALSYDECQSIAGKPTRRRSTALFRVDAQGPNGLRWATLHETWVTPPA